jgi:hypothetical protein
MFRPSKKYPTRDTVPLNSRQDYCPYRSDREKQKAPLDSIFILGEIMLLNFKIRKKQAIRLRKSLTENVGLFGPLPQLLGLQLLSYGTEWQTNSFVT